MAAGAVALALAPTAAADTFVLPENNAITASAEGWESTVAACTSTVLADLPFCSAMNTFNAGFGVPAGSLQSAFSAAVGALGDVEARVETVWSNTFTYLQGAPTSAVFSYQRRSAYPPLINLGMAEGSVTITDLTTGGVEFVLPKDTIPARPQANLAFDTVTANVTPSFLVPGHTYRVDLRTDFEGTLTLLGGQQVNYDNVRLTIEAPPGDPRSSGPRGPLQVLPGAGGLGACTTDDRRVPAPTRGRGNPAGVTLSAQQLLINQRISQAAVRRVNAIIDRITKGLTGNDLRECALNPEDFNANFVAALLGPDPVGPSTGVGQPRKTPTRPRQAADPASVKLERTQLVISQRIAQAAVRRVNAAAKRLAALTAGDFQLGTLGAQPLASEMRRLLGGGAPTNTAGSTAFVPINSAPAGPRNPGAVKLTRNQLLINQRISQAAVRRINHLTAELASGITSRQIVNGSLTRSTLTPAVQINQR